MKRIIDISDEQFERLKIWGENPSKDMGIDAILTILRSTPVPYTVEKHIKCFECAKAVQGAPVGNMCGKWECEFERR